MLYVEKFLSEYSYVIDVLKFALFFVISLYLFSKTKDVKYLNGVYDDMITRRTPNYQDTENVSGQKFSNLKPVYRLNKVTGELELTDEYIDITELVNSSKSIALDNVLERFLPTSSEFSDMVVQGSEMQDDIDMMRQAFCLAEDYRVKYKLDDLMPVQEVFKEVQKRSNALNERIKEVETLKKVKKELEDEKSKTVETSKPPKLPESGEQGSSEKSS